jgi:hypothetical protein
MISLKLKFFSESRGALIGNLACMKAFSFSVSHLAVGGTVSVSLTSKGLRGDLQSGSRKKRTTPNITVMSPSTRKTL